MATCRRCHEGNVARARFCETCGHDMATLRLQVSANRAFYDHRVVHGEAPYPEDPPSGTFDLTGDGGTVGRLRTSQRTEADIALADRCISTLHCELTRDKTPWSVCDLESANGTWVEEPEGFRRLSPDEPWPLSAGDRPLEDGDRIFVGCWTCLTVEVVLP